MQNHVHDLSKSKIVSTTYQKAKVVPQPLENQNLDMFPQTQKGISAALEHGNPFISGFSSLVLCVSCQQNYGLDVEDSANHIYDYHGKKVENH